MMFGIPATMKLLFTLSLLVQIARAAVKGPPTASHHRSKQIVLVGSNVRLQCPMSGHPNPMIDWTKDKEGIIDYSWTRFEASKKVLKISRAQLEDTGIYRCKGTNGFGSTTVRIDLIVIDPSQYPGIGSNPNTIPDLVSPVLTQETLSQRPNYRKKSGDSVRLVCEALGVPEPQVTWLRNGHRVQQGTGRSVLHASSSGRYSCVAANEASDAAVVTKNFTVSIPPSASDVSLPSSASNRESVLIDSLDVPEPALVMTGPENSTVDQGMKASLECRVQSAIQSEIMWLKQLEHPSEVGSSQGSGSIIDLGTDKFKILEQQKGTAGAAGGLGSGGDAPDRQTFVQTLISASEAGVEYLNTMIIDAAVPTDAGTYYCFVKNPLGYKFKGAYLNVIPKSSTPAASGAGIEAGSLLILIVCVVLVVVVLLTVIVTVCVFKRRQKTASGGSAVVNTSQFTSSSHGGVNDTSATPELTENLMRQHQQQQNLYMQQQQQQFHNNHYHQPYHQQLPPPPPPNSVYHQQISNNNRNGQMNLIVSKVSDHHQQQQPALPHLVAGSAESWMQPAMYHQHLPTSHNQPAAAVPTATSSGGTTNHYIDECQNQYEVPHAHEAANGRAVAAGGKPLYGYKMY